MGLITDFDYRRKQETFEEGKSYNGDSTSTTSGFERTQALREKQMDLQRQVIEMMHEMHVQALEEQRLEVVRLEKEAEVERWRHEERMATAELDRKRLENERLQQEVEQRKLEEARLEALRNQKASTTCVIL